MNENLHIESGTIARTACLLVALVNEILTVTGHSVLPFTNDDITQVVSFGFMAVSSIWAWWKNNSFTQAAIKSDADRKSAP